MTEWLLIWEATVSELDIPWTPPESCSTLVQGPEPQQRALLSSALFAFASQGHWQRPEGERRPRLRLFPGSHFGGSTHSGNGFISLSPLQAQVALAPDVVLHWVIA